MSRFSPPRLGALESGVLEHIWESRSTTARAAHEAVGETRGISLNTVQSTLDRLHRKGLLRRKKVGRAFHYAAGISREGLLATLIAEAATRFGDDRTAAMSALIEAAERLDDGALDELERLIRNRRAAAEPGDD